MKVSPIALIFTLALTAVEASESSSSQEDASPSDSTSSDEEVVVEEEYEQDVAPVVIFNTGNRRSGWTYFETFDLDSTTEFEMMGEKKEMTISMQMDSETVAQDLPQGGQEVHMTIERVAYSSDTGMINLNCDTEQDKDDAEAWCKPFYDLLADMTFTVDDKGLISDSTAEQKMVKKTGAAEHLKASARLLNFIPARPIKQGESWDNSMELDGLGYFEGSATFLGKDKENDCVVISIAGDVEVDFDALMERMGADQLQGVKEGDIRMTNSVMAAKMCWNDEAKMAAWTETNMDYTLHVKNPANPQQEVDMPMKELIKTSCQVKKEN